MCLQKEDISFGDVYRLLPASDGRTDGRRGASTRILPEANSAQARLVLVRAIKKKKLALFPSLTHSNHPLIRAARSTRTFHDASPAPSKLLTLSSLLAFF